MALTTFSRTTAAGVTVGDKHVVGLHQDGRWQLVLSSCPHRGGPLHFGQLDRAGTSVTCPWHGRATVCARLKPIDYPWVRVGDHVTVLASDDVAIHPILYSVLS
ncbi:Rieske 2Fe-2S domain-containing protein [Bordetella sp. LUAb4]|uniref:Rieske (2Fe-2S) protein n=1 Tax=Bordetella sp. LUAb4 TaxID=2843195 RepID=UPI001E46BFE9|nr:Rieske 2Fe-2S domain-containing protein [Bordetella sp. LUAb4]